MDTCKIDNCERPKFCRGWCKRHYERWYHRGGDPSERQKSKAQDAESRKEQFDRKWRLNPLSGCWEWIGATRASRKNAGPSDTRGVIMFGLKEHKAHRAAWIVYRGKIPKGKWVLHTCDNSLCVNPDHLYLGNHSQNMRDLAIRHRAPNQKLSDDQVRYIRASSASLNELASMFGVSFGLISNIRLGRARRHVT